MNYLSRASIVRFGLQIYSPETTKIVITSWGSVCGKKEEEEEEGRGLVVMKMKPFK